MLQDICKLTKVLFDEAFISSSTLSSPKHIYDTYRSLECVIENTSLVSEHYLALKFDEPYLQNSGFGTPVDKWRLFLNKDFESLNGSIKIYLKNLSAMAFEDAHQNIMSKYFSSKAYDGFVRDEYTIGHIDPCSTVVKITALCDEFGKNLEYFIVHKELELETFEQRVELQTALLKRKESLDSELLRLKAYIKKHYILDDLF